MTHGRGEVGWLELKVLWSKARYYNRCVTDADDIHLR